MSHHHHHHAHDGHDHSHHGHVHHGHSHASKDTPTRRLSIALALTASFMLVEVGAGWWTHSLALLSDAGHMLTDAGALVIALLAQRIATRRRTGQATFGYRRAEVLAALANGLVLGVSAILIFVEGLRRLTAPAEVLGLPMFVVATVGLVLNLVSAWVLSSGGGHNANVRAAAAHVMADAAGSVAAMLAGGLVWAFGWNVADPITSMLLSVAIVYGAWKLVRDAVRVLMEGTPPGVDPVAVQATIRATPGVSDVHDLHLWCISDGMPMASVHVVLAPGCHGVAVAEEVARRVRTVHHIDHVTVQPEADFQDALVQLGVPEQ